MQGRGWGEAVRDQTGEEKAGRGRGGNEPELGWKESSSSEILLLLG